MLETQADDPTQSHVEGSLLGSEEGSKLGTVEGCDDGGQPHESSESLQQL